MKSLGLGRYALAVGVAAAMLAGCGGSQPPIDASGARPQGQKIATHAAHGTAWMLREATSEDLIHAARGCNGSCVISYPALKLVGSIPTSGGAICSDAQGNVFLVANYTVTEYAHGGSQPIATLNVPSEIVSGCAVDPGTNNLAVVAEGYTYIYSNEMGTPSQYTTHIGGELCGYDDKGNLFVNGYDGQHYGLAELANGASDFAVLSVDDSVGPPGQVQWDGKYITWQSPRPLRISRLAISGSNATIVGQTKFRGRMHYAGDSWIYGSKVIAPYDIRGSRANVIGVWKYPQGGRAQASIRKFDSYKKRTIAFTGVTISVAPPH